MTRIADADADAASIQREKPAGFSVNQFLSKRFEFLENFRHIRIEYAQKLELPLQAYALACVPWRTDIASKRSQDLETRNGDTVRCSFC
jgi:hypothetical protein